MTTTCPHCGEPGQGAHPFCLACGGDLDASLSGGPAPVPPERSPADQVPEPPAEPSSEDPASAPASGASDELLSEVFGRAEHAPTQPADPGVDPTVQAEAIAEPVGGDHPPRPTEEEVARWLGGVKLFAGLELLFALLMAATAWVPKLFLAEPVHPAQLIAFSLVAGMISMAGLGMFTGSRLAYKVNRWLIGAVLAAGLFALAGMVIEGFQTGWGEVGVPVVLAAIGNGILALAWFYLHDHDVMDHFGIEHDGPDEEPGQA